RSADVRSGGDGAGPRRQAGAGTAGRAAGREFRIPRVPGDAPKLRPGGGGTGEFRRGGARMHDAARLQDAFVVRRGGFGNEFLVDKTTEGGRLALDIALVLDRH